MSSRRYAAIGLLCAFLSGCGGGGGGGASTPPPTTPPLTAPAIATQPTNQNVTEGAIATFSIAATGTEPLTYQWQRNGENISGATTAVYSTGATVSADDGANFTVQVSNSAGTVTSSPATLAVTTAGSAVGAPTIIFSTGNVTIPLGTSITLQVLAVGTPPLTYSWRKNGVVIPGATVASYAVPNVALSDDGAEFEVIVSNASAQTASVAMTLHVLGQMPTFTVPPAPQTVFEGQPATFSAVVSGSSPMTFQWFRDSVAIPGATSSSYTLATTSLADSGALFFLSATNSGGLAGRSAVLTVTPSPPIQTAEVVESSLTKMLSSRGSPAELITDSRTSRQVIDTAGSANVALTTSHYPSDAPLSFEQTIGLAGVNDGSFNSDLSLPATSLALQAPVVGAAGGVSVIRFERSIAIGQSVSSAAILNSSVVSGFPGGLRQTKLGFWKYIAEFQPGYFAGWPTTTGVFVTGEVTPPGALPAIPTGTYSGYAYARSEVAGALLLNKNEFSTVLTAEYSAASQTLTITLTEANEHAGRLRFMYPNVEDVTAWPAASPLGWTPETCTAQVQIPANTFTCSFTGSLRGTLDGRFFGPSGSEIAATFILVPAGTDHGFIGALSARNASIP